jgi:hypothetical protein
VDSSLSDFSRVAECPWVAGLSRVANGFVGTPVEEADHLGHRGHVIKTASRRHHRSDEAGIRERIAANGSVLVHDAEIAMVGSTSEDVDATLSEGVFRRRGRNGPTTEQRRT